MNAPIEQHGLDPWDLPQKFNTKVTSDSTYEYTDPETGEIRKGTYVPIPFFRTPYNYDRKAASDATGLVCPEPTKTQQQFAEDANINTILERFHITGQLPENVRVPLEGDFTEAHDFHSAMNVIRQGQEAFAQMPANVREEFANDPGRFLAFVQNPSNRKRAEELGIVNLPPKAETVTPPAPGPAAPAPEKKEGGVT